MKKHLYKNYIWNGCTIKYDLKFIKNRNRCLNNFHFTLFLLDNISTFYRKPDGQAFLRFSPLRLISDQKHWKWGVGGVELINLIEINIFHHFNSI